MLKRFYKIVPKSFVLWCGNQQIKWCKDIRNIPWKLIIHDTFTELRARKFLFLFSLFFVVENYYNDMNFDDFYFCFMTLSSMLPGWTFTYEQLAPLVCGRVLLFRHVFARLGCAESHYLQLEIYICELRRGLFISTNVDVFKVDLVKWKTWVGDALPFSRNKFLLFWQISQAYYSFTSFPSRPFLMFTVTNRPFSFRTKSFVFYSP